MTATLTVLGAGSILPREGFGCAGYALRPAAGAEVTLLDCGPGSVRALGSAGIDLCEIRRVVLSHFHTDHCLDLFALFFARRNPDLGDVPPLAVYGPPGTEALVRDGVKALRGHPRDPDLSVTDLATRTDGRTCFATKELSFEAAHTHHTPESLAWRVELPMGASVTYTGDSTEAAEVAQLARGCSLLVAECSFSDAEAMPNHLTPSSAGRLAQAAGCDRLLLSHFYPGLEPEVARKGAEDAFDGPVDVARDGSVHTIVPSR